MTEELIKDAEFWVGIGLLLFFGLLVMFKVPSAVLKGLDAKTQGVKDELAEAERIRKEAEALLADLRQQHADAKTQAEAMLADAKAQAEQIAADAKAKAEEQIKRRQDMAEKKIAQAEADATAQVRAAAADLAIKASTHLLAERVAGLSSDPLVDAATSQLSSRLS